MEAPPVCLEFTDKILAIFPAEAEFYAEPAVRM